MCGIAGTFVKNKKTNLFKQVSNMISSLDHRGPDDFGVWVDNNIGMGHKRLSILDLSPQGAQPMHSSCGRYVLIYNGEIYNHLELRAELNIKNLAPKWRGTSDTESLLAYISSYGLEETLKKAHGMFALALWDKKLNSLNLARDRMGEKPLYWGWAGYDFVFGSEIKALHKHTRFSKKICFQALSQYLRYMYIPAPRSIYNGIYKLEPGTMLSVKSNYPSEPPSEPIRPEDSYGEISIKRYWDLNYEINKHSNNLFIDEGEAIFNTELALRKAIHKQMLSDVPIGAFLSGGVDSSLIASLMQDQSSKPIQTFTIGFQESAYDESHHAAEVSNCIGSKHSKMLVTNKDAMNVIPNLPNIYDEPFADSSQIPTYLVSYAARQEVTVALSGDGGDELFGGYNRYIQGPGLWKNISFMPLRFRNLLGISAQLIPENAWNQFGSLYNLFKTQQGGISNFGSKAHKFGEKLKLATTLNELHKHMASAWIEPQHLFKETLIEPKAIFDDPINKNGIENPATRMMFQDMRTYLPDDILCKVDRAAMSVSLETRTPFLDPEVIAVSSRIPINMKIRDDYGKWILRQILYKYVPKKIIERPKTGFAIPIGIWLRGPLRDWAEDLLSTHNIKNDGIFNNDLVQNVMKEHMKGNKDLSSKIWTLLMFQSWKSNNN